jgi:glycosyltransferase involved in cell wall biosynthesis
MQLDNVVFLGVVPHHEIGELYDAVDVYLNSPNFDCMPGSLIECFASGVPVVSTRAGGIPYIVTDGETGLLVDTDDHEALASRAIYLLENPSEARAIIERARRECVRYTWAEIRPQWLALYERLALRRDAAGGGEP